MEADDKKDFMKSMRRCFRQADDVESKTRKKSTIEASQIRKNLQNLREVFFVKQQKIPTEAAKAIKDLLEKHSVCCSQVRTTKL